MSELKLDNLYAKLLLPLWVSILECDFLILIFQEKSTINKFRETINLKNDSAEEKWIALVNYFFKHYYLGNQKRKITVNSIGDIAYHRYTTIIDLIKNDLCLLILLRNKIVHGQWSIAYNFELFKKNQDITQKIWELSKKDILFCKSFITNFNKLIYELLESKKAFEMYYEKYVNRIHLVKKDLDERLKFVLSKKKRKSANNKNNST